MITKINELYDESIRAGKQVSEIVMSNIAYDHLKSELNNYNAPPHWLEKVKVKKGIYGIEIVKEEA